MNAPFDGRSRHPLVGLATAAGLLAFAVASGCGPTPTAADGLAPLGVAECDEYLTLARSCLASAPQKQRPPLEKEVVDHHALWSKAAAAGGLAKDSLSSTCRIATAGLRRNPTCR
jgi:hypothetical protein